jgi:hypothetical protein
MASCYRKADRRKLLTALGPRLTGGSSHRTLGSPARIAARAFGFKGRDSQWSSKCFEFVWFACKPKAGTMVPVLALPFQAHCLRSSWQMFCTPDGPWDLHNSPDGNHVFETSVSSSLQARCRALKSRCATCTPRAPMCTPRAHHVHTGEGPGSPGSSVFLMCMCVCVCVRACVRVSVSVHADLECTQRTLIIAPPPNEPSPLPDPTPYASCHRKADRRKLLTALGPRLTGGNSHRTLGSPARIAAQGFRFQRPRQPMALEML